MYEQRFHPDRAVRTALSFAVFINACVTYSPPTAQTCISFSSSLEPNSILIFYNGVSGDLLIFCSIFAMYANGVLETKTHRASCSSADAWCKLSCCVL